MIDQSARFEAPVPGQSLTSEPKLYPWETPPELDKIGDVISFYIERLSSQDVMDDLFIALEEGFPLNILVKSMLSTGVMEGMHSLDVGIIISPAIAEAMTSMADAAEVMYVETSEEYVADQPYDTEIALALNDIAKESGQDFKNVEPVIGETEEEEPKGLMSRRQQ